MVVRKLCMYQAYDHTHTRTQQQSNKYSASIFSKPCMYDTNSKIFLLFLNVCLLDISNGLAHMDVYRHILECRFTHFAPYVVTC